MQAEEVLNFWFGRLNQHGLPRPTRSLFWFQKDATADKIIRVYFEPHLKAAIAGELDGWADTPRGRLALIVLCDQFSRNMYRATPAAFLQDDKALQLCTSGIDLGMDQALAPIERVFFYFPLEHAESLEAQQRCVDVLTTVITSSDEPAKTRLNTFLDYAVMHRDIIARFGRFPHRNKILGRISTSEEAQYMAAGAATFGQA